MLYPANSSDMVVESLSSGLSNPLTPTGKLPPQAWMTAPQTVRVMKALAAGGHPPRFVGGCVRDAVLARAITDIDIATPEKPERVIELLENDGIRVIPTGLKHGTVTAIVDAQSFEITTLRIDVETDGRHADVRFTDDWQADAKRRDFTINALSATLDGDIYDPFFGLDDLAAGRVRFVGNAYERIEEDYLRILRFFRFQAMFGRPPPNGAAIDACRQCAPKLANLSAERVRAELFRILLAPNPADTFTKMRGVGAVDVLLPEVSDSARLRVMAWMDSQALRVQSVQPDAVRRLAALLEDDGDAARAVAGRLRLSNQESRRLVGMLDPVFSVTPDQSMHERDVVLYKHGSEAVRDVALLAWATERVVLGASSSERSQAWIEILTLSEEWLHPIFPLSGDDVKALGVAQGPALGVLLAATESWWVDGGFKSRRDACLANLKKRI